MTKQGDLFHIGDKVAYVADQEQVRPHECHWPDCRTQVPPAMWGCKTHWFKLPASLRRRLWIAYEPGQEITMTPSDEYMQIADEIQKWIKEYA